MHTETTTSIFAFIFILSFDTEITLVIQNTKSDSFLGDVANKNIFNRLNDFFVILYDYSIKTTFVIVFNEFFSIRFETSTLNFDDSWVHTSICASFRNVRIVENFAPDGIQARAVRIQIPVLSNIAPPQFDIEKKQNIF